MNHAFKELLKSSLTIFLKKLITSAYSMSSISLGLNPVLQKFYEMIYQIMHGSGDPAPVRKVHCLY